MNLPGIYGIPKQASVYLLGVFGSESAPRAAVVRRPPVDSRHDARGEYGLLGRVIPAREPLIRVPCTRSVGVGVARLTLLVSLESGVEGLAAFFSCHRHTLSRESPRSLTLPCPGL